MSTYSLEKKWTQLFMRYFKRWFRLVHLWHDKQHQFAGVDMTIRGVENVDIKFHFYPGLYFFLEMYNTQHKVHENSYIKSRKDGKKTDFVLYICLEQGKAFLIDYNKAHELALKVEKWLHSNKFASLTEVTINGTANGTLGMTVPIEVLEPIETYTFQPPESKDIRPRNVPGFLDKWEELELFYKTQLL